MRSLQDTLIRWKATFANSSNLSDLKAAVRTSSAESPSVSGLRSICWKSFLLFENLDTSTWSKTLWQSRSAYTSVKEHYLKDIDNSDDLSALDPLADDETSPWNTLRRDEVLREEIYQDVERCMPENLYFREPLTQSMLLNILFIYCKLNADVGYRQGMHEVLAPVIWVVSRDAIDEASMKQSSQELSSKEDLCVAALDAQYIEHDAFTLFCIIMQTVKAFYELGSSKQITPSGVPSNSPIVDRSRRIHQDLLSSADPELSKHLTVIEILPQIFLIRWIRLLFGREFPFDDLLSLWDVLFAEDPTFELVDFVCVAMLLRIRWQLMEADYSSALTLLLRYPIPQGPNGPSTFLNDAIYLRGHLNSEGGKYIISKYSQQTTKPVPKPRRFSKLSTPRSTKRGTSSASSHSEENGNRIPSAGLSPARFLSEQGGIEGIIQEAARGVYKRGEQWGVAKALRGAVIGISPGQHSPLGVPGMLHDPTSNETRNQAEPAELAATITALEQRNKALSKMLENVMGDLWTQQRIFDKEKAETAADALSLALAKIQFVQVYLGDSSIPMPTEETSHNENEQSEAPAPQSDKGNDVDDTEKEKATEEGQHIIESPTPPSDTTRSAEIAASPSQILQTPTKQNNTTKDSKTLFPFHRSRPSLAQSSFSWMLGEDQSKTSFVSPTFPSEKRRDSNARGKAGFLFGDESLEGKAKKDGDQEGDGAEQFTLGTLKGAPKGFLDGTS